MLLIDFAQILMNFVQKSEVQNFYRNFADVLDNVEIFRIF